MARSTVADARSLSSQIGQAVRMAGWPAVFIAVGAFVLYWLSSFVLQARGATTHFGADAHLYVQLAHGHVVDRVARFHPVTVILAKSWMTLLSPLASWISPLHLMKAMFAAIGALGVWAAMVAFASALPRRYVILFGIIYACSLGSWYFSSIEESKIVTATLSTLYIATYLHLRERWTLPGACLLATILLVACLNEIVSGFLVIIPLVDTVMRHGFGWRHVRWIFAHALVGPLALLILELVVNGWWVPSGTQAEGASHLSMLLYYVMKNDYSLAALYRFAVNWLFFNIAAPSTDATRWANPAFNYAGEFEPALLNYFTSPVSGGAAALGLAILAISGAGCRGLKAGVGGLLLGLLAYALLRGVFFLVFNPNEPLLFSPAVTLAYMLLIAIPFAASNVPARRVLLAVFAALLFIINGAFIIGRS